MASQSDYDDYFSEPDEEIHAACTYIESVHSSPEKQANDLPHNILFTKLNPKSFTEKSNRTRNENAAAGASSSTSRLDFNPTTPSKDRVISDRNIKPHTPRSRRIAVQNAFSIHDSSGKSPTPRKLFPSANPSRRSPNKNRMPVVDVGSDSDDSMEVASLLVDTYNDTDPELFGPSPLTTQSSLSSIGSEWDGYPTFSSTRSPTSADRLGGSPSKYRKLDGKIFPARDGDLSNNGALFNSQNNGRNTSQPLIGDHKSSAFQPPIQNSNVRPMNIDDVFSDSTPSTSQGSVNHISAQSSLGILTPPDNTPENNAALERFLDSRLGEDLPSHIIAHDREVLALLDREKIPWGVQWELARGLTEGHWTWADVKAKVRLFVGTNAEVAFKARNLMLDRPPKPSDLSIWQELDREQHAILENRERGLGPMHGTEAWHGENNWYGGQIQQLARIVIGEDERFKIRLEPMEQRRSYRLARFLGSRRVLQLRVPRDLILYKNAEVRAFMAQKFILCGRVFVPWFAKDNAAYLVETHENYERTAMSWCGDQFRRSFKDIVNWHNRLDLNVDQPIAKYATRFALALSTSVPVIIFEEENIVCITDIHGDWQGPGKIPADHVKTDGCGYINGAALIAIARALGSLARPIAVQGRVFGAKGLWILHPTDTSPEPRIWIRDSQRKIIYPSPLHRAHRIFDLLLVSVPSTSISLSTQSIMNLSENGVKDAILIDLMKQALINEVRPLMMWEGPQAMESLWDFINKLNSVSRTRVARLTAGLSRVLGLTRQSWRGEEIEIEKDDGTSHPAEDEGISDSYTGRNRGGAPASLSEFALELLQAGFLPKELGLLREKIRYIITTTIRSIIDEFSISLPESLSAFVIPDPLGVLEEGEIYYNSSRALIDPVAQSYFNVITGDVLVGRYPIRLASDIQKVKAVDRPELSRYVDVVVVSTKGKLSFASLLSGGDYDGDTLFVLREKAIVDPFVNKPMKPIPSRFAEENFKKNPERVKKFAERVATMSSRDAQENFQKVLLLNLDDAKYGLYSNYHDYAIWKYGYEDARTERLAYIFNALLDSSKTGDRLKDGIFETDRERFGRKIPEAQESPSGIRYIFHTLHRAGSNVGEALLRDYDETTVNIGDKQLLQPYKSAADRAMMLYQQSVNPGRRMLVEELERIRGIVDAAYAVHKEVLGKLMAKDSTSPVKKSAAKAKSKKAQRDPKTRVYDLYEREVPDIFLFQNVDEIKASYAYHLKPLFAFDVAFRDLCTIKAKASPLGIAPSTRSFDEAKSISSTWAKAMARFTPTGDDA